MNLFIAINLLIIVLTLLALNANIHNYLTTPKSRTDYLNQLLTRLSKLTFNFSKNIFNKRELVNILTYLQKYADAYFNKDEQDTLKYILNDMQKNMSVNELNKLFEVLKQFNEK